jgi:hypothetical protein
MKVFLNAIEGFIGDFIFGSGLRWPKWAKKE